MFPTIRLTPDAEGVIIQTPDGRDITIGTRDGWSTLIGVLNRITSADPDRLRQEAAREKLKESLVWVPGEQVDFVPPSNSPWRRSGYWPVGADKLTVEVICEAKDPAYVRVRLPGRTTSIELLAKNLRHQGIKKFTARGKLELTLDDLGL